MEELKSAEEYFSRDSSLTEPSLAESSLAESSLLTTDSPVIVKKTGIVSDEFVTTKEPGMPVAYDITQIQMAVGRVRTKRLSSSETFKRILNANKGIIDNSPPIDSVKDAVSKFGGIVDWKAHKVMALEKHAHTQNELEKSIEDIPLYRKQSEATENAKQQVLAELEVTNKLIEELEDNLEKSRTEEAQAKQDSELAQLRVREMEQGISDDASTAAKAQLEVAKARHESAVQELKSVVEELQGLRGDYHRLINERDLAVTKAEEPVSDAKEAEKKAEELTLELIAIKEALELAHASHLEAEERRIALSIVKDQEVLIREKELTQAKEELKRLTDQHLFVEDLKSKFEIASTTLLNLKTELAFYLERRPAQGAENAEEDSRTNKTTAPIHFELCSAKKEFEEVKDILEKAKEEVIYLRETASSLKVELDLETEAVTTLRLKESVASVTVSSLEAELCRMQSELELVLIKEREAKEKMEDLPKMMQQATYDVEQAKYVAQLARKELDKAKEEAEEAKAGASALEVRLLAALKETEAAKRLGALAVAAVKAMEESEKQKLLEASIEMGDEADDPTPSKRVTLQLEEYYRLSKSAHDSEEAAKERVIAAVEEVKDAKSSEQQSLEKLEEAIKVLEDKKEALRRARAMADKATDRKLVVEQELNEWRAENEPQRRASDVHLEKNPSVSASETSDDAGELNRPTRGHVSMASISCPDLYADPNTLPELKPRRKKSFFPRIVMYLSRKKSSHK